MLAPLATGSFGFAQFLVGGATLVVVALLLSFWPAMRGHWSAPVLAIPGLLGALALLALFSGPHSEPEVQAVAAIPALLGISSIVLWSRRKNDKSKSPGKAQGR